jgi:hypothetical protein
VCEVDNLQQLFEVEAADFVVEVLERDEVEKFSTFNQLKDHISNSPLSVIGFIKYGVFFKVNQSNHIGMVEGFEYVDFRSDCL